jgi:hypothetical protein
MKIATIAQHRAKTIISPIISSLGLFGAIGVYWQVNLKAHNEKPISPSHLYDIASPTCKRSRKLEASH